LTDTSEGPPARVRDPYVTDVFNSAICNRLLAYWQSKKAAGEPPFLADIDLMELYDIAPFMGLCDAVDDGEEFIARFYGTGIVDAFGFDRTGLKVRDRFQGEAGDMVLARLRMPYRTGRPARVVGYLTAVGKDYPVPFEAIYLPLMGSSGTIAHVIGACDIDYRPLPSDNVKY
jgi:hypothetical protein